MLTQEDNLLFQSYFTFVLLVELRNHDFQNSEYFENMRFGSPWIQKEISNIGIDNQGCALIALYVMLVIPRELISKKYPNEYSDIGDFLKHNTTHTSTNYPEDIPNIDYLRHIRNSVTHGRVSFKPKHSIIFEDERDGKKNTKYTFRTELPLIRVGALLQMLQSVHLMYIQDLQRRNTSPTAPAQSPV